MAKKLPATLYVKIEKDSANEYFVADPDAYNLVEMGQKIKIGVYKLVETNTAEGIAKLTKEQRNKARA